MIWDYDLGQRFTEMVRERQPEALLPWLEDAAKSGIGALKQFARGIKQDLAAVTNALSLPWSNGQTEGRVNRLKLIKRQTLCLKAGDKRGEPQPCMLYTIDGTNRYYNKERRGPSCRERIPRWYNHK